MQIFLRWLDVDLGGGRQRTHILPGSPAPLPNAPQVLESRSAGCDPTLAYRHFQNGRFAVRKSSSSAPERSPGAQIALCKAKHVLGVKGEPHEAGRNLFCEYPTYPNLLEAEQRMTRCLPLYLTQNDPKAAPSSIYTLERPQAQGENFLAWIRMRALLRWNTGALCSTLEHDE